MLQSFRLLVYNKYMYNLPTKKLILLKSIAIIVVVFGIISSFFIGFNIVYTRTYVNGRSMLPTLNSSLDATNTRDVIYINKFANVKPNDIVVLDLRSNPNFGGYAVKRLIANPGDIVNIVFDGDSLQYNVLVNGKIFYSKPFKTFGYNTYDSFVQYVATHQDDTTRIAKDENQNVVGIMIKQNEVFVLGDNWDVSKDSALVGPLKENSIVGRVDIVVNPHQNEFAQILKRIF